VTRARSVLVAAVATALLIVAGAGAAEAVSKSGTLNCPNYYPTGKVVSTTSGVTRHTWVNSDSGAVKIYDITGGIGRSYTGYQRSTYVVTAPTVSSATKSCV